MSENDWETGKLGRDEKFVKKAPKKISKEIDAALNLQAISIRLEKGLIDKYKEKAELLGIGYQTLIKNTLKQAIFSKKSLLKGKL